MERLQTLLKFIEETPSDPFLHFAVAMEYLSINDLENALIKMEFVTQNYSGYLPHYYQLAKLYEQLQHTEKAIETYEKGIELAFKQKELKTAGELRSALEELTF